jgi:hypothetical protein
MRGIPGTGKSTTISRLREAILGLDRATAADSDAMMLVKTNSGSARSTSHIEIVVCSADAYFVDRTTGHYTFDRSKLQQAHTSCFNSFLEAIKAPRQNPGIESTRFVVVDNTNTRLREYERYVKAAERQAHVSAVYVIELSATLNSAPIKSRAACENAIATCAERNVHHVSLDICGAMHARWEQDARAIVIPAGGVAAFASVNDGGADGKGKGHTEIAPGAQSGILAVVTELAFPSAYHLFPSELASARCAVVHDAPPSTAKEYAVRRGGHSSSFEARTWAEHLQGHSIEAMANSLMFLCLPDTPDGTDGEAGTDLDLRLFPVRRSWSAVDAESERAVAQATRWACGREN